MLFSFVNFTRKPWKICFRQIALINKNFHKLNLASHLKGMTSNVNIVRKLAKFLLDVLQIRQEKQRVSNG